MNLRTKKKLIARVLGVGKGRIIINSPEDLKEAITRQDIRDLIASRAITLKEENGRRTIEKRKNRRGPGKVKKTVNRRKKEYMLITRKLRKVAKGLKSKIKNYEEVRKKIKSRQFRSLAQFQEYLRGAEKK